MTSETKINGVRISEIEAKLQELHDAGADNADIDSALMELGLCPAWQGDWQRLGRESDGVTYALIDDDGDLWAAEYHESVNAIRIEEIVEHE